MNKIKKSETEWKKLLHEKTYNDTRKSFKANVSHSKDTVEVADVKNLIKNKPVNAVA